MKAALLSLMLGCLLLPLAVMAQGGPARIRGTLQFADGSPCPNWPITYSFAGTRQRETSDNQGQFFLHATGGDITVGVEGAEDTTLRVGAGETKYLTLTVRPPGILLRLVPPADQQAPVPQQVIAVYRMPQDDEGHNLTAVLVAENLYWFRDIPADAVEFTVTLHLTQFLTELPSHHWTFTTVESSRQLAMPVPDAGD